MVGIEGKGDTCRSLRGSKPTCIFPHCDASPSPLLGSTPQPTVQESQEASSHCQEETRSSAVWRDWDLRASYKFICRDQLPVSLLDFSTLAHTPFPMAPLAVKYWVRHEAPRVCVWPHLHPYCRLAVWLSAVLGQWTPHLLLSCSQNVVAVVTSPGLFSMWDYSVSDSFSCYYTGICERMQANRFDSPTPARSFSGVSLNI